MIPYERVEKALARLAETDQPMADLKADVERTKYKAKAIHSAIVVRFSGEKDKAGKPYTVKHIEGIADNAPDYQDAMNEHFTAIELYEGMRNERHKEELVIDVWRSINAARNKGQIV